MKAKSILLLMFGAACMLTAKADRFSTLAGKWTYRLDSLSVGEPQQWFTQRFSDPIALPGTTDDAGIGNTRPIFRSILGSQPFDDYPKDADFGMMTRRHKYIGRVWYQKEFTVSPKEAGFYRLHLERVMWLSKVWLDGQPAGKADDVLSSPHLHELGYLQPGKHVLTILVDNSEIYPIGKLAHSYCPHMQTQWNGIIGDISLERSANAFIDRLQVIPSYKEARIRVQTVVTSNAATATPAELHYTVREARSGKKVARLSQSVSLQSGVNTPTASISIDDPEEWNEFDPNLYRLEVTLETGGEKMEKQTDFGFRDLGIRDKHITVNGEKIIYRNSHEGMFFGKTGYPEMGEDYWTRIFRVYKRHGFNSVRFHSSCPPEAAFVAADRLGLYLQVEFFWMDGWMGYPELIGKTDARLNAYVVKEMERALQAYGNHPSMALVAFGNELGGDFDWMAGQIEQMKKKYPNHLFAAGIAHNVTTADDFVEYGGKQKIWEHDGTDWDYTTSYETAKAHNYDHNFLRRQLPEFTHETGQYIVHPLWSEIKEYDGLLAPLNLEYYRGVAEKNGIAHRDYDFQRASGQINKILYKTEIEATRRTPSSAGYALLSMVDYPGQGEALVGWVTPMYKNKNFMTPKEFMAFGAEVVPLLRFGKYVWTDGEEFTGRLEVSNYGSDDLDEAIVEYEIACNGKVVQKGTTRSTDIPKGGNTSLGTLRQRLEAGTIGQKYEIRVRIKGTDYRNSWQVWCYPQPGKPAAVADGSVVQTDCIDRALEALKAGRRVLLYASKLGEKGNTRYASFAPVFWSATWFKGQETDVSGACIDRRHQALALFETDDVMDWQWRYICTNGRGFVLNDFPASYTPIIQPVNDFHHGNKLGTLFELRTADGGRLLVCGYDLLHATDAASCQLHRSLLAYVQSDDFNPQQSVGYEWLAEHFQDNSIDIRAESQKMEALLYVMPGSKDKVNDLRAWNREDDEKTLTDGFDYSVENEGVWEDNWGVYWIGKEVRFRLKIDNPALYEVRICVSDPNSAHRSCVIRCEDIPEVKVADMGKEKWVTLPITREHCLDGNIDITVRSTGGPNVMVSRIAVTRK